MSGIRSILLLSLFITLNLQAQVEPTTGLRDNTPLVHAFTEARIVIAPGRVIEQGTLVIRDGLIESVGDRVTVPADARVWNMRGLTLYPGFIDAYSSYGLPRKPEAQSGSTPQRPEAPHGAAHWNSKARSDFNVADEFRFDEKTSEKLMSSFRGKRWT